MQLKIVLRKGDGVAAPDNGYIRVKICRFFSGDLSSLRATTSPRACGINSKTVVRVSVVANRLIIRLDTLSGECNLLGMWSGPDVHYDEGK